MLHLSVIWFQMRELYIFTLLITIEVYFGHFSMSTVVNYSSEILFNCFQATQQSN